jgi:hypothetical protein
MLYIVTIVTEFDRYCIMPGHIMKSLLTRTILNSDAQLHIKVLFHVISDGECNWFFAIVLHTVLVFLVNDVEMLFPVC